MEKVWEAFATAGQKKSALWKKLVKRSVLQLWMVWACFSCAQAAGWQWAAELSRFPTKLYRVVGASKIDEDGNHAERYSEAKNTNRKCLTPTDTQHLFQAQ